MNNPKRESSLKSYSPLEIEKKWQKKWIDLEAFNANVDRMAHLFVLLFLPQMLPDHYIWDMLLIPL